MVGVDAGRGRQLGVPVEAHLPGGADARIASRRGKKRAAVAVAHSMLVSAYYMLQRDEPYREVGADWFDQRHVDAHTRRLVAQLKLLGHTVILDPADSLA